MSNNKTFVVEIKDLFDAEKVLNILEDKQIPIINTCGCISEEYKPNLTCKDKHIILIPKRYEEIAINILRFVEEGLPILY